MQGNLFIESVYGLVLLVYVFGIVYAGKALYHLLVRRGLEHIRAVYYVRKFIHIFGGGVVAVLTPFLFKSPLVPFIMAMILALSVWLPRRRGQLLYWFQVPDNAYEVNFCIAWGVTVALLWLLTGNPFIAVMPAMLISFGDAVTGVVRNAIIKRRAKHWVGNVAMAAVTVPLGWGLLGPIGALTAGIASIIERFEMPPIDDNILIAVGATAILLIAHALGFIPAA